MLNKVWAAMIAVSVFCALATGRMQQLSEAVLAGAGNAVQLIFGMMGMMCAWTGLMKIADAGGLTAILSRLLAPVLRRLFPAYPPESPAAKAICMNITANLLGLGNAATPMGLAAMKEMAAQNRGSHVADNSMVMFVVLNTASLQYGDAPGAVWIRSAVRHFARRVDGFRHRAGCRPFGGEIIGGLLHWINWEYMWFRLPCC